MSSDGSEPTANLPTRHGVFDISAHTDPETGLHHLALVLTEAPANGPMLTRVHSECLTGDVLGSLRCDCGPQLDLALELIGQAGRGALVYLRQEGRGIGLVNKIRAYALQDEGLDTVEANERLGFPADLRDYGAAARILTELGIRDLRLLTNNPVKVRQLEQHGLRVAERVPLEVPATAENTGYLTTKQKRMGHLLGLAPEADRSSHE